jgi:hypothetical protein
MIRSFDWRDVGLVKTLSEQGLCLDSETALTHGPHPLQSALLDYLMPGAGRPTLIWRGKNTGAPGDGQAAFGQLHHRLGRKQARVLFIAPQVALAAAGWAEVVERLAQIAGERGAHNLLAEVSEDSAEFDALRTAGFAIYARQSVWKLPPGRQLLTASVAVPLRPAASADAFAVSTLYSNVVPRLVQQVEQPPRHIERGYVLEKHGELIAFLDVRRGPLGIWVKPYLHPEAYDLSDAVLQTGVSQLTSRADKPIYVCVPRYEDWLQNVATRAGFEALGSQAVMVKRLAVGVTEPLLKPLPAVEGKATTPAAQIQVTPRDEAASPRRSFSLWLSHAKTNHGRFARSDERDSNSHRRRALCRQSHGRTPRSHPGFGPRADGPVR